MLVEKIIALLKSGEVFFYEKFTKKVFYLLKKENQEYGREKKTAHKKNVYIL